MDYAQARLQARFGERPDESLWRMLENAGEPAVLLEIAGACSLRRWIAGIGASSESHTIEIALRARWRDCVAEVTSWMPRAWQPATEWTRQLADLPALCHLARGEALLAWMSRDPVLQPYALAEADARETKLKQDALAFVGPLWPALKAPVSASFESKVRRAWHEEWRRRWPGKSEAGALDGLAMLLESGATRPSTSRELLHRLRILFRRSTLSPAVAFVFLAFVALDIARLRAALLKHALLRDPGLAS